MEEFFSKPWVQGLGLLLVAGLLAIPYLGKLIGWVFPDLVPAPLKTKTDFTKQTVLELMTLKANLEKQGTEQSVSLCRELIVALVTGDSNNSR